jgi:uncharacterized repeat protein (TIGR03803 family)
VFKISSNGALTSLHSFAGGDDGANPVAALVLGRDGSFYGTTQYGGTMNYNPQTGTYGSGTVFKIRTNGVLTSLYSFPGSNDGANPQAGLVQGSDGMLYGTTRTGGTNGGYGTVFKINPNGTLTSLYSFGWKDGGYPAAALVQGSDGYFYGTTDNGGTNGGNGTVFKINPDGVLISLYSFTGGNDGAHPYAGLVQGTDGYFYGTTGGGGNTNLNGGYGYGTVFKISPNGALNNLYSFTGDDGWGPNGLVQGSDGSFYGTTYNGGTYTNGTVFKISPDGVLTNLYSFTGGIDGEWPDAALVRDTDGSFYGTTSEGGTYGYGTVFRINPNGALTNLYSFTGGNDGIYPHAALVQGSDGNFYGTISDLDTSDYGTVFKISPNGALTNLYSFTGGNNDGYGPNGLVQGSTGNFYGTTVAGGAYTGQDGDTLGTVFQISPNGVLTNLYSFTGGSDGGWPYAGLVQGTDGNFYGTTTGYETDSGMGAVFKINSNGALTILYSFTGGIDGANPSAALVQGSDGYFYGTTYNGGTNDVKYGGDGTVFKISPNGALTNLYSFGWNDGANPEAALVQGSDGYFYGTTSYGGTSGGYGTVFRINPNGALTSLYSFTGTNDGEYPNGLVQGSDGYFYGTTQWGGTGGGNGTVFRISTNGLLTILYLFTGGNDGANPSAALVEGTDGYFYGATEGGGTNYSGTVFKISPNGALTSLYSFTGGNDGATPLAGLVQGSDGSFYGTTSHGGQGDDAGTVFRLTISPERPQLSLIPSGPYVFLTWPTNYAGFKLQSTTNLGSSAVWTTNSPAPVVVNGQNIVTNLVTGTRNFFRLSQ